MDRTIDGLGRSTDTNMSTTIGFDHLEVDIPRAKGPDGKDLGSTKWMINIKILWTTQASKKG
jgi:hypothetical protein